MAITPAHSSEQAESAKARRAGLYTKTDRWPGHALPLLLAGVPATFFYAWFITNGTFNFFGPERHGLAYGSLLLHMLHGSLQVDKDAIGLEGIFIGDKVYMYYGMLPALLRLPFVPFVDLAHTTVSRIVLLILTVPASAIWHYLLLVTIEPYRARLTRISFTLCLFIAALLAWIISPSYALCATATIYHEPVAAALLLTAMFTLTVWRGISIDGQINRRRLIYLSIIAALSVHTRLTVAIGLYAGTVLYLILEAVRDYRENRFLMRTLVRSIRVGSVPTVILLLSGAFYLWTNWLRWGAPFTPAPGKYWGYHLFVFVDGFTGGSTNTLGRFDPLRIPVNLIAYFVSDRNWMSGVGRFFGSGVGRMVEPDSPMALLWLAPLAIAVIGLGIRWFSKERRERIRTEYLVLVVALAIPALMLLSYPTINYRYKLLLWPLLLFAVLIGTGEILNRVRQFHGKLPFACILAFAFLCTATIIATSRVNTYYKLFRGLDENGMRSTENFFLTRLLVPKEKLSKIHVMSVDELADFERERMAR